MSRIYHQLRWLVVLLFLLFIGECKSSKRIQRRFMWKQVDNTMDDLFDSMASSARAMKNMLGEIIPGMTTEPTHSIPHSNVLDYLPSETTKIKYVIRNPSTKPMKIIKMNVPKKVIKIMAVPKPIFEVKHNKPKFNFGDPETLRQMEKEQELIAEGRIPIKSVDEHKDHNYHKENKDIVRGQIQEFGTDWQTISTVKPYAMSQLHTNVLNELLPQPQKEAYGSESDVGNVQEETKQRNTYEVTENTPEETVPVPYTQHYQNSRGFIPIRTSHQPFFHDTARVGLSATTSTTTTATTTAEAPNYPVSFLKKYRERPVHALKPMKTVQEINPIRPSNATIADIKTKPTQFFKLPIKSPNWEIVGPTLLPSMIELSTQVKLRKAEPLTQPTSVERLKAKPTRAPTTTRPRDIRQRGTIKFGDKLAELYK